MNMKRYRVYTASSFIVGDSHGPDWVGNVTMYAGTIRHLLTGDDTSFQKLVVLCSAVVAYEIIDEPPPVEFPYCS